MFGKRFAGGVLALAVLVAVVQPLAAQQVKITNPFLSIGDRFYENFGIGWGLNHMGRNGGWYFNTMPANATPPMFGGYDPGADMRFGFGGVTNNGTRFNFNLIAGQGSDRSMVMEAPTIVIPNGGTGGLFSGSQRPFVTGIVPIVGNAPMGLGMGAPPTSQSISPLQQRLQQIKEGAAVSPKYSKEERKPDAKSQAVSTKTGDDAPLVLKGGKNSAAAKSATPAANSPADSTANRGDISVAEIRKQKAAEEAAVDQEVAVLVEKARGHEEAGNLPLAKVFYQQAAARASGEVRQKLVAKMRSLTPAAPAATPKK